MARNGQVGAGVVDGTVPVSIRFSRKALKQIRQAAEAEGDNASNWIRRKALAALREKAAA